jgi:hypothetical protein
MVRCLAVVLGLSLALAGPSLAASPPPPQDASARQVRQLMVITGVEAEMKQIETFFARSMVEGIHRSHPDLPPGALQDVQEGVAEVLAQHLEGPDGLMERTTQVIQRHFTPEDVGGLIRFYQSPLGHKWVQEQPLLMKDVMTASREWGMSLEPELKARIQRRLKKYGVANP